MEEGGKSFNLSRASRVIDITVDKSLIKKYDEYRMSFLRLSRIHLGIFLIALSAALKLYLSGQFPC